MNVLAIIITIAIVLFAVFILGFRIFLFKNGEFPNIHIGGSKALGSRGISCATTQDADAQKSRKKIDIKEILSEIEK